MSAPAARLGVGVVRHARLRPVGHAFEYPTWFVILPLRSLARSPSAALPRNRRALIAFHDRDHGAGGDDCLAWIDSVLQSSGIRDADGEVWLHTMPRVLGFVFKPVSFWYCHGGNGALVAVVVEVNNTFGQRHSYVLSGDALGFGRELQTDKVLQVSPFCRPQGLYRFRFMRTDLNAQARGRTVARIDYDDGSGPLLRTSVSGAVEPLTRSRLWRTFARMPWLTLGVMVRIHTQALRLALKRVPFLGKNPATLVSRP